MSEKKVNQVIVNGEELINLRNDTVSPQTLVEGETATNREGEHIQGELDPVSHDEAYLIDDPEGDIDDSDYIPFNDVSDEEQPKKKTLFSSIVAKLRGIFATKTGDNITDKDTFRQNIHTLEWLGTDIPDNSDLDTYTTAGNYRVVSDGSGATIANLPLALCGKVIVFNNGNSGIEQFYFANHSPRIFVRTKFGSNAWSAWKELGEGGDSKAHTYEMGTNIPANSDFDDYKTEGVYYVSNATDASTISNIPVSSAGKLIVMDRDTGARLFQIYMTRRDEIEIYMRDMSNDSVFSAWKRIANLDDITPAQIGNGYAVATVSGSAITATISGFKLRAGVIVALKIGTAIPTDATLNISNTGAKSIQCWGSMGLVNVRLRDLRQGGIYSFIYTGSVYIVLSYDSCARILPHDYVADTSGDISIEGSYDQNAFQLKYNLFSNKLLWNYCKNSAWRGDKGIIDVTGGQTMEGWLGLKTNGGRTIASGAHSLAVSDTIPNILNELRYSNGAWGSFNLTTAYTKDYTTIPTGWYNYFYIPHRVGGENWAQPTNWDADNVQYGTLLLFGMVNTNGMFRLRWANGSVVELENMQKGNCYVGTCTTAGATKDKVATVDGNFVLRKGVRVAIKFSNTNTYSSTTSSPVTLNVNNTGAKNIWYASTHSGAGNTGTGATSYGEANRYHYYIYDGTYWVWDGRSQDNNSTYSNQSLGNGYGTCTTAEATTAKLVTLANYNLISGGYVTVRFDYNVPANATMNINSKGAKGIYYHGTAIKAGIIKVGDRATFVYDGTNYQLVGIDRISCGRENCIGFSHIKFGQVASTLVNTANSHVRGEIIGGVLYFNMELRFSASGTLPSYASTEGGIFMIPNITAYAFRMAHGEYGNNYVPCYVNTITYDGSTGLMFMLRNQLAVNTSSTLKISFEIPIAKGVAF